MAKQSKKRKEALSKVDVTKRHTVEEAVAAVKATVSAKFDESVDVAVRLGVNPRHADQMGRGAVNLPHGTGKKVRVLVFAKGEKEKEARAAGADFAGSDDLVAEVQNGMLDFDRCIATPDMMGAVGKLGRVLGPRGLMPNPKVGSVTFDVANAVKEAKAGKVEYRVDKAGVVHARIGLASFGQSQLVDNLTTLVRELVAKKPASAKGIYLRSITLSSTMGLGVRVDNSLAAYTTEEAS
jgi:large subunit ribosomal protein L1